MHRSLSYLFEYRISIPGNSYRLNDFRTLEFIEIVLAKEQLAMISIDVFKSIAVEIQLHEKKLM